jgi:hypothetical protein
VRVREGVSEGEGVREGVSERGGVRDREENEGHGGE